VSDDRYYAACMFGGSHVRHNPGGLLWEVGDHEHDEEANYLATVIDGITEEDAKDLANRLNRVEQARPRRVAR